MRAISKSKLVALWICFLYLAGVAVYLAGQAVVAFFHVSKYKDEAVPRSVVLSVVQSGLHALLLAVGVVALGVVTLWIMSGVKQTRIDLEPPAVIPTPSSATDEKK